MAKTFIVLGVVFLLVGLWLAWGPKIPLLGKLPGDIVIKKDSFTFYFPLATCLVLSLIISLLIRWFGPK